MSSKDDLLRAVAELGYVELARCFEVAGDRAIARCRARAVAYVRFAQDNPELFRVMFRFRPAAVLIEADNELPAATEAFDAGNADIAQAIQDGDLRGPDVVQTSLTLWAAAHGVASISLLSPRLADQVIDDVLDAMFLGLRHPGPDDVPTTVGA